MNKEEMINKARDNAKQNFREGLNCAESVLAAIIDTGVIEDFSPEVVAVATGFGGGIGLYGAVCGALAGVVIAVGCVHGRKKPKSGTVEERVKQLQGNPGLYRLFNNLVNDFVERFGSCDCIKLTYDFRDDYKSKERKMRCLQYVVEAAGMATEYIMKNKDESYTQKMRKNWLGMV